MSELTIKEFLEIWRNDRHFRKGDVVTLSNGNDVVIAKKIKDKYVVYPVMQNGSPYKSYFRISDEDIKRRSSLVIS